MKASHPHSIVCPVCESGELRSNGTSMARCDECGCALSKEVLEIIQQIAALPDAVGGHACECGHPEMRRLPDNVYWCPACGSEVVPISAQEISWKSEDHSEAYWCGWLDGRYKSPQPFSTNRRLQKWEEPSDRLDYYRGHRAGREARLRGASFLEAS